MISIKSKPVLALLFLILALGLIFVWQKTGRTIDIGTGQVTKPLEQIKQGEANPLNGLFCKNFQRRPLAVVLAEDPVTRPLAGLSQADLVFEMPVITGSITRLIAVYVCNLPDEIGSLRSARHDFIPLTMGLDAILVHWGGSHFALDQLDNGVMDNIDAMANPYNTFYQKRGIPQPHNGFTTGEKLINGVQKSGYRMIGQFEGYPYQDSVASQKDVKTLRIDYSYPYNVKYVYDPETNSYSRYRANSPEMDRNSNQQIRAKNIVVMRAFSRQIEGPDYNDLDIEGTGKCQVYQNGEVINCTWQKSKSDFSSKLYFLDDNDQEIPFVPGQVWIQIVEPSQNITWR